jgi:hypothetical protein
VALKRYLDRLRSGWVVLAAAAAAIVAFYKGVGTVVEATSAVVGTATDVWARWASVQFGIVLAILIGTVVLLGAIWWQEVLPAVATCWRKSTTRGAIKTGASVALLAGIAATVTVLLLHDVEPEHLRALFAQAESLNARALRTYGTDGRAEYEIHAQQGRHGSARICPSDAGPLERHGAEQLRIHHQLPAGHRRPPFHAAALHASRQRRQREG